MLERCANTTKENTREKEHHLSFRSGPRRCCHNGAGQRGPGRISAKHELVYDDV